jgi:hypothetical protein
MITELNSSKIKGARYSGKKFLSRDLLKISYSSHLAIGFARSKSYKTLL